MGLASWLGFRPRSPDAVVYREDRIDVAALLDSILAQPVEKLWRDQPHLRTVVGFVARNIAHLGLHVFERDGADGRNRVRSGALPSLLAQPNESSTLYDLIYATVASYCLYDVAYWFVDQDPTSPSGWIIRHIPTRWILGSTGSSPFSIDGYKVALPNSSGKWVEIPAANMAVFKGFSPTDPRIGTSPVHALKAILAEQIHAQVFRDQIWQRGGRVGTYIKRPVDAPQWSEEARARFAAQWQASYAGDDAPKAGGNPLLEDGMTVETTRFSAKDEQFIEAAKLSLQTVAQVYHINPTMVGLLDNANYSNVREFRRMLYGDTLGPYLAQFEQVINTAVVPRMANSDTYVEFNLSAKLAGSFEEQGAILQQAIGAPYMTRNEGRAKLNMPAVDGGDELIVPLNVTANGDQNPIPAAPDAAANGPKNGHANDANWKAVHVHV